MIYPIVAIGDPVLKKHCKEISKEAYPNIKEIVSNMFETMYNANGVGLAAPQVGLDIRLFVVDASGFEDESCADYKRVFINPVIEEEWGEEWAYEEGCLSIPGVRGDVVRFSNLSIRYFDENWKECKEELDGMAARVIQHEYDHIEGVLFVEHFSAIKKRLIKGKLTNISKGICDASYRMKFPLKK
jgi:peptide deformylase